MQIKNRKQVEIKSQRLAGLLMYAGLNLQDIKFQKGKRTFVFLDSERLQDKIEEYKLIRHLEETHKIAREKETIYAVTKKDN